MSFKKFFIIYLLYSIINTIASNTSNLKDDEKNCLNDTALNTSICGKPPLLIINSGYDRYEFCSGTIVFLKCLDGWLAKVCDNVTAESSQMLMQFNNLIKIFNQTFQSQNCTSVLLINHNQTTSHVTAKRDKIVSNIATTVATAVQEESKIPVTIPTIITQSTSTNKTTKKFTTITISDKLPLNFDSDKVPTASTTPTTSTVVITSATAITTTTTPITTTTTVAATTTIITSTTTTATTTKIDAECGEFNIHHVSCQSLALHRTCGYPAANPNNNIKAFCNELTHYIRCAKCRIKSCSNDSSIPNVLKHIKTQEETFDTKCVKRISVTTKPKTPKPTTITTSTTTTTKRKPTSTRTSTATVSSSSITTSTSKQRPGLSEIDELLKGNISNSYREYLSEARARGLKAHRYSTQSSRKISIVESDEDVPKSKYIGDDKTKSTSQPVISNLTVASHEHLNTRKSMINIANMMRGDEVTTTAATTGTTTTGTETTTESIDELDLSNLDVHTLELLKNLTLNTDAEQPKKLNQLIINFDLINIRNNTSKVYTSIPDLTFDLFIVNRTDVFKGIKNGAIYLHSKTYFTLNLNEHIENFCITSVNSRNKLKMLKQQQKIGNTKQMFEQTTPSSDTCEQGWTISFWIKVSNLNLFDKTIIRVDTFSNRPLKQHNNNFMKYLIVRISNFDIRIQFLYKKKLWTVSQNVIWKSEWSQIAISWHEFEGITVYLNDRKVLCQQQYEIYNHKEDNRNKMNLFSMGDNNNDFLSFQNLLPKTGDIVGDPNVNTASSTNANNNNVQSMIYFGLNNKVKSTNRKMFWMNREEQNNYLLTTAYAEAILIDEFMIYNYRLDSKQILELYLKEYTIRNEYDSVQELMHLSSTDAKQSDILLINGANVKKVKDSWLLNLNGNKQFVLFPSLVDACIADAENLCYFGFSLTLWFKLSYNFLQFPIQDTFEQSLFFMGANNFQTGLEAFFSVVVLNSFGSSTPTYNYVLTVNLKAEKYTISKHFKIYLKNINQLEQLNCLTIQFSGLPNIHSNIHVHWLDVNIEEIESTVNAKMTESGPTYPMHISSDFNEFDIKSSVFTGGSNSIGLFGDINKQSYFSIENIEFRNYDTPFEHIETDYLSANPTVYELNSIEKLFEIQNINIVGNPQIVETRYGKSLLFSKLDQKVILTNVSNSCFGNLNMCEKGYTLKMWLCFTNFNNNPQQQPHESSNFIHLVGNGGHKINSHGIALLYDVKNSRILAFAKTYTKWYKLAAEFKIKLYTWYIVTMSFDSHDGLRLYINNRLMDQKPAFDYIDSSPERVRTRIHTTEFTIGNINLDDDMSEFSSNNKSEHPNRARVVSNNNYEFIIHKIVQYDLRKYPDEIVSKNVVIHEKKPLNAVPSMNWLWYTIGGTFLVIGLIAILLAIIILKRRNSINGSWSREHDNEEEYYKKSFSKFCCTSQLNFEDTIVEKHTPKSDKPQREVELKQCQFVSKNDDFRKTTVAVNGAGAGNPGEEFPAESLFGTIDRLLYTQTEKQQQQHLIMTTTDDLNQTASVACTSAASLYKEIEIHKKVMENEQQQQQQQRFPPLSLTMVKNDYEYNKKTIINPEF